MIENVATASPGRAPADTGRGAGAADSAALFLEQMGVRGVEVTRRSVTTTTNTTVDVRPWVLAGVTGGRDAFEAGEAGDAVCAFGGEGVCGGVGGVGKTAVGAVGVGTEFALVAVFDGGGGEGGEGGCAGVWGASVKGG